jgi:hypothetical protein
MKRTKPLRRTRWNGGPDIAREPKPAASAVATLKPLRRGTYAGSTAAPAPKTAAYRDPALLEMARGRPCLLLVPGVCNHRVDTTVACHSNLQAHGKAGARKADDCYSVWGCAACHSWLDQGRSPAEMKEAAFVLGLMHQQQAWCQVTNDPTEPERFRRAAGRALHHILNTSRLEHA